MWRVEASLCLQVYRLLIAVASLLVAHGLQSAWASVVGSSQV